MDLWGSDGLTTELGHQEDVSWPHQPQVLPGSGTCLHTYDTLLAILLLIEKDCIHGDQESNKWETFSTGTEPISPPGQQVNSHHKLRAEFTCLTEIQKYHATLKKSFQL
ncbi:cortexin-3 isoform X4 [Panthera tigris]|uniref:cortexin-3 isoform X4 n=1 Tax=Panthera tigris TaxID=9694 RepID=UPI001C6F66D6|nr:cortexin-3 isoform X4 [Panthera tigris]